MAFDLCFDKKLFLETTCRCCSRFFTDSVKFYKIFEEKLKCPANECSGVGAAALSGDPKEMQFVPSDDVKDIMEDLKIWNLNITPMDGLPQQLCEECYQRFKQVHSFREECLDSQKILLSYFLEEDHFLDAALLSPKADSDKSGEDLALDSILNKAIARSSPKYYAQDIMGSPFSSPRLRLSPRITELGSCLDTTSSIGTPPPLFEEIKTEPIDMVTLEVMKPESELLFQEQLKPDYKQRSPKHDTSSDEDNDDDDEDESSTPTSDEDTEVSSSSSDDESSQNFQTQQKKPKQYHSYLRCKICGHMSNNRQQQKKHILRFHPQEKPFECDICTSTFKSSFMLAQHKLKHNRPDTVQCQECAKYFRSQLHLQRHVKNFHLKSTYTCHICNQQFENYTQMRFQYHVRQHGEKRFTCSLCSKAFHQKIHLINHERTHTNEQPFRCDFCGKAYRQQSVCQEHMKTHKDPTPFKCKHCPKAFSQRSTLRMHIQRTHNMEKNANPTANAKLFEKHNFINF